jgi:hypothetical protein
VDGEDEEFAHGAHRSMTVSACKTAPHRRLRSGLALVRQDANGLPFTDERYTIPS